MLTPSSEELRQKLDALRATSRRAEEQAADMERMRERIGSVSATATSTDKAVTVTAGPGGAVTDIQFTQEALNQSPSQLSATALSTVREAVADAARQQAEIVQEYAPDGDVLERVMSAQEQMLGTTVERPQPPETHADPPESGPYDEGVPDSFLSREY